MSNVEETLRIQATRTIDREGEEDFEDFDECISWANGEVEK